MGRRGVAHLPQHALLEQDVAVDTRLAGGDNRERSRCTLVKHEALQRRGWASAVVAQNGVKLAHHGRDGAGITHHLHGERCLRHKVVQRQNAQDGVQHLRRAGAGQPDQALRMRRGGEICVGQHDLIPMPHGRQHMQQVGRQQRGKAFEHGEVRSTRCVVRELLTY